MVKTRAARRLEASSAKTAQPHVQQDAERSLMPAKPTANDFFEIADIVYLVTEAVYDWGRIEDNRIGPCPESRICVTNKKFATSQQALKNLRLVNSTFCEAATGLMFRNIHIRGSASDRWHQEAIGPYSSMRRSIRLDLACSTTTIGQTLCRILNRDDPTYAVMGLHERGVAYLLASLEKYQRVNQLEMNMRWMESCATTLLSSTSLRISDLHFYQPKVTSDKTNPGLFDAGEVKPALSAFFGNVDTLRFTFGPSFPGRGSLPSWPDRRGLNRGIQRLSDHAFNVKNLVLHYSRVHIKVPIFSSLRTLHLKKLPIEGPSLIDALVNNKSLIELRLYEVQLVLGSWSSVIQSLMTILPNLHYLELHKLKYGFPSLRNSRPTVHPNAYQGYVLTWFGPIETTLREDRTAWVAFLTKLQARKRAGRAPVMTLGAGWDRS